MTTTRHSMTFGSLLMASTFLFVNGAHADKKTAPTCPEAVTSAIRKAHPDGTMTSCQSEGRQYTAMVREKSVMLDIDVSPDGKILQTEQNIVLGDIPAAVTKAFAARYPKSTATRAEKQTHAGGRVTYELAFSTDRGRKEATFDANGTFVEEE